MRGRMTADRKASSMRVAFVTNFCPHYRVATFETLSKRLDVQFYFFSSGDEWYWSAKHGVKTGQFRHEYLRGFNLGPVRIVPSLIRRLWGGRHDVIVKCIQGRFALPASYVIARLRG